MSKLRIKLAPETKRNPGLAFYPAWCSYRLESVYEQDERWVECPIVDVFMTQPAYCRVYRHSLSDLENEVGGVLAGRWHQDVITGKQFIVVDAVLPARHTRHGSAYLTFTTDSLLAFQRELEDNHPGRQIIGWYHTHPGMGIFLSGYDTWLHAHFFPEQYQIALVIEPRTDQAGFFIRLSDGFLDARRFYGFYELNASAGTSIVNWRNLQKQEDPCE